MKTHIGLIAEEVNEYFPNLVPKDEKGECASIMFEEGGSVQLQN